MTLCDPMDCGTPGFPIHHQLPELAQMNVHRIGDTIQPLHPLSSPLLLSSIFPSIRAESFPLSQFSASCGQSTGASASASVLPVIVQDPATPTVNSVIRSVGGACLNEATPAFPLLGFASCPLFPGRTGRVAVPSPRSSGCDGFSDLPCLDDLDCSQELGSGMALTFRAFRLLLPEQPSG